MLQFLPLLFALALAAQPAEAQQPEETTGATPWQAQIYSGHPKWTKEDLRKRARRLGHRAQMRRLADRRRLGADRRPLHQRERIRNGHRVRLGADYIDNDEGVTYRIDRMVRHADWNKDKHTYDIALVHFVADAETPTPTNAGPIEAIPLYDGPPLEPGVECLCDRLGPTRGRQGHRLPVRAHLGRPGHRRLRRLPAI